MVTAPPRRGLPGWVTGVPLAHRGLHGPGTPENSLAAFAAARDAGVGVELDVHVTADGTPVVLHDHDLRRVAGVDLDVRRHPLGAVREHVLADGSIVPTLAEALDTLGDVPVMVEIKNLARGWGQVEPAIALVLDDHPATRTVVASFHPGSLRWFRRHRPRLLRAQTAKRHPDPRLPLVVGRALGSLLLNGRSLPHLLSYDVHGLDHGAVRRWRRAGGVVIAWTVRTGDDLDLARQGADNVIFEDMPVDEVHPSG